MRSNDNNNEGAEMTTKASAKASEQVSELTEDQLAQVCGGLVGFWEQLLQQLIPPLKGGGNQAQQAD